MLTSDERLLRLEQALAHGKNICSSAGTVGAFPDVLMRVFPVTGIGLIVCEKGGFSFSLNQKVFSVTEGETLFIPIDSLFQVLRVEEDLQVSLLFYQIEPIRDILGNSITAMHLYSLLTPEPCYVMNTGEEKDILMYASLLGNVEQTEEDVFSHYERKLLLLALTYRLCSIYSRKMLNKDSATGRKTQVFIRLVQLIEKHYMQERDVAFYADKLCLSPKHLSALSKSVCGYTVQQLVFKAIIRKSISLLKNTQKSIQEISDDFNFPNASYFGTFFKKQTGVSPQQYRETVME